MNPNVRRKGLNLRQKALRQALEGGLEEDLVIEAGYGVVKYWGTLMWPGCC